LRPDPHCTDYPPRQGSPSPKDYAGYPEYPQVSQPFDHYVTVLDLLFAVGPDAPDYVWGSRRARPIPARE